MMSRTETVFKSEQYDENFPPPRLLAFRDWLDQQIALVPEAYRDEATIEIDNRSFYDSVCATVTVSYERPATAKETADETARREAAAKATEAAERAQYEQLRQKFGE